jgi:N-acetylglucosamine-6-sulfatase
MDIFIRGETMASERLYPMRFRLSLLPGLAGLPLAASGLLPGATRPNLLFVLMDDVRWDELGCTGHTFSRTPNIDRIVREGAQFTNAFATTPLCSPSRACFLTGRYAHTHGILDNVDRSALSHRLVTFPKLLHDAGYETGFVGKWHMGVDDSPRPGFDYWFSVKGQGAYFNPEINENGRAGRTSGYITDIFTDRAVAFLNRKRTRPFLLCLSEKAVHPNVTQNADGSVTQLPDGGVRPAPRHASLYAGRLFQRRPNAESGAGGKPALMRQIGNLPPLGPDTGTDDETIRNRARMMASVDEGLGRIREVLSRSGELDNTVIIFTSDEGYFFGEHGLSEERRLAYEESIRIPMLVRYPGLVKAGSKIDRAALNIDIAPTLLDLAGVTLPPGMHGRSLVPLLKGNSVEWRRSFLIEYFSDTVMARIRNMGYQAVRTDTWKYIRYTELRGMDELYNLQTDPYEMKNLINDPAAGHALQQMRQELARLLQESGAPSWPGTV